MIKTRTFRLSAGLFLLVAMSAYSFVAHNIAPLARYAPDWTLSGWLRVAVCVLAASLIAPSIAPDGAQWRTLNKRQFYRRGWWAGWLGSAVILSFGTLLAAVGKPELFEAATEVETIRLLVNGLLIVSVILSARVCLDLNLQGSASRSAFWVAGLILVVVSFFTYLNLDRLIPANLGAVYMLNAFLQPDGLQFLRSVLEFGIFSFAALYFVVLPFVWTNDMSREHPLFARFVPQTVSILYAFPVCGFLFQTWNIVPLQFLFFLGVVIRWSTATREKEIDRSMRIAGLLLSIAFTAAQVVFVTHGKAIEAGIELTELRYLQISWIIVIYLFLLRRHLMEGQT